MAVEGFTSKKTGVCLAPLALLMTFKGPIKGLQMLQIAGNRSRFPAVCKQKLLKNLGFLLKNHHFHPFSSNFIHVLDFSNRIRRFLTSPVNTSPVLGEVLTRTNLCVINVQRYVWQIFLDICFLETTRQRGREREKEKMNHVWFGYVDANHNLQIY